MGCPAGDRGLVVLLLLASNCQLLGQTQTEPPQGPSSAGAHSQVMTGGGSLAPAPESPVSLGGTGEELAPPQRVQDFKFTKIDYELLKQVDQFDNYVEEKGWVFDDPETNAYLARLGSSLVPAQTPENVKWRFRAIRDLEVNAFALPNGSIYVDSGLLARMENEAQVAGVIAHEVTHVVNRHGYLENRSYRKKMVAIEVIQAAAGAAGYAGAGFALVNVMGNMLPMIVVSTIFGYSRELEHEADVYAVNALQLRGYDLREFSRSFELLRKGPEVDLSKEPVFWASHPKLADRVRYVAKMAQQLQPNATSLRVGETEYRVATRNVIRQNAGLAIMLGQPRTAVAVAERLIAEEPNNANNLALLGDAYRTLGARTPVPADDELTDEAKKEARKQMRKMTIVEYDKALLGDEHGAERWEANAARSEETYRKALAMDPDNANSHRGLGFLYERKDRRTAAAEEFRKYLALTPGAKDSRQIRMHIASLEKASGAVTALEPEHH
jgi:beta-barrel assembly-enhancing protease